MKKYILILLCFFFNIVNSNAQIPVTDVAANSQLAILNSQLASIISLNTKSGVTEVKGLGESYQQGQTIVKQYNEIKKVQQQLSTVTSYVQTFNGMNKALEYSFKSFSAFNSIINKLKNIKEFKGGKLDSSIDVLNSILQDNNEIINKVKKMLTSDGIKTDEGIRLKAIEDYTGLMKKNYKKLNDMNSLIDGYFPPLVNIKD